MNTDPIATPQDLLELYQNDHKSVMKGIQKFAKDIFDGKDEDQKKDLLENLLDLVKYSETARPDQPAKTLKRQVEVKDEPIEGNMAKKPKHDPGRKVQVPYDIWLKIMNYLDTKDLFKNFNLACRKFNFMSMDSNAVKYLTLSSIKKETDFKMATKVIRRSKLLVEIKIDQCKKYWKPLMLEALKKPKLKSIKIQKSTSDVLFPGEKVKTLGKHLERLDLREVMFSHKILKEIIQIKTLKSITGVWIDQKDLAFLTEYCHQIETLIIDAQHHGIKPILDKFFQARGKTLKSLKIHGNGRLNKKDENILENINLCENLEHLSLNNLGYQLPEKTILDLENLKTLHVIGFQGHPCGSRLSNLLENMNRSKLKQLFLEDATYMYTSQDTLMVHQIEHLDFPNLERFYVQSKNLVDNSAATRPYIDENLIKAMLEKSPNLKSIQLYGKCKVGKISDIFKEYLEDLCIQKGIYMDFRFDNLDYQNWMENCMKKHNPTIGRDYLKIKNARFMYI